MKAQPLAYNKDNQEDKEPLFDAVDTAEASLAVFTEMLSGLKVNREALRAAAREGYATATDLADYLVKKGVPFRAAHEIVAQAVRYAESRRCDLAGLKLAELQRFSRLIGNDVFTALSLEGSLRSRRHIGGTAPVRVRAAIAKARKSLR
jgi:argininosuccinate lyase